MMRRVHLGLVCCDISFLSICFDASSGMAPLAEICQFLENEGKGVYYCTSATPRNGRNLIEGLR